MSTGTIAVVLAMIGLIESSCALAQQAPRIDRETNKKEQFERKRVHFEDVDEITER